MLFATSLALQLSKKPKTVAKSVTPTVFTYRHWLQNSDTSLHSTESWIRI